MIPNIPWYIATIVVATSIAIAIVTWRILSSAAGRSGLSAESQRRVRIGSALFLFTWLGGTMMLAPSPASLIAQGPFYVTPLIPLFVVVGLGAALFALWRSPSLRSAVSAIPLHVLSAAQAWRLVGIVFVVLFAQGQLPGRFALPAGWGDFAVGLSAPLVALALARDLWGARTLAISWNVLGLLDLVVAVGTGTGFLSPELGTRAPAATAMGMLPMFLVPAFAVPMSFLFHVLSLERLLRHRKSVPGMAPTVAK